MNIGQIAYIKSLDYNLKMTTPEQINTLVWSFCFSLHEGGRSKI